VLGRFYDTTHHLVPTGPKLFDTTYHLVPAGPELFDTNDEGNAGASSPRKIATVSRKP
jgi:hypothetical protein